MEIIKLPDEQTVLDAVKNNEPMIAAISTDGKTAVMSPLDYGFEHHILISKADYKETDIDKFFRIVFDKDGADWTFVCPPDYKNIALKNYRIKTFYKDGLSVIGEFLSIVGYCVGVSIPKRYKRHFEMIYDGNE